MEIKFNSIEEVLAFVADIVPNRPTTLEPEELANQLGKVANGGLIAAIKIHRAATGLGIRDSKAAIDRHWPKPHPKPSVGHWEDEGCGDPECCN